MTPPGDPAQPSPLFFLPNELIANIFEYVCDAYCFAIDEPLYTFPPGGYCRRLVGLLLAPIHIDSRIRSVLWASPRIWRAIARSIAVPPYSVDGYLSLLRLCDERSYHTLDTLDIRRSSTPSHLCWMRIKQIVKVYLSSAVWLKSLWINLFHMMENCNCLECSTAKAQMGYLVRWLLNTWADDPDPRSANLEMATTNAIFRLLAPSFQPRSPSLEPRGMATKYPPATHCWWPTCKAHLALLDFLRLVACF